MNALRVLLRLCCSALLLASCWIPSSHAMLQRAPGRPSRSRIISSVSSRAFSFPIPTTTCAAMFGPKRRMTGMTIRSNNKILQTNLWARRRDHDEEEEEIDDNNPVSPLLQETSKSLRRVSFLSWWGQVILTTVSGVILVFARNVLAKRDAALSVNDPSFFLSGSGLILSAISILWTWGNGARLSRRLIRRDKPMHRFQAANMLRRAIQVGVSLNLAGLLVHLLAAEEIVGSLAIQVLTTRGATWEGGMYPSSYLQPLDVLIVQANTNALLSHFCSLVALLFMTKSVKKLDPPSVVEDGAIVR